MTTMTAKAFYAYASAIPSVASTIEEAVTKANQRQVGLKIETWANNDIGGRPITAPIIEKIKTAAIVFADISTLNLNVAYEVGFAIGSSKRVLLTRSISTRVDEQLQKIGIFDTLGYSNYANEGLLAELILKTTDFNAIILSQNQNIAKPLYIVQPPVASQAVGKLLSAVKKARYQYRSFKQSEDSRLSAMTAIDHVASSFGVIIPLLTSIHVENFVHNMRACFVAGLAHGMDKPTLLLMERGGTPPLDLADEIKWYQFPDEIAEHVGDWIPLVAEKIQSSNPVTRPDEGFLRKLRLGDPMAENEFDTLGAYFHHTDNFTRALRGEVTVVVGRKGSGKTALWTQLRDTVRNKNKAENIVIDLKPEGYQLLKLRESVIDLLSEGAQAHLLIAFWEYLLLLEIAYKILEKDAQRHMRDHRLVEPYGKLKAAFRSEQNLSEGDFSERLLALSANLSEKFRSKFSDGKGIRLVDAQVTEILYCHDIRELREAIVEYLSLKQALWILFDNLDKGWTSQGLSGADYMLLRCLIDAGRKLKNDIRRSSVEMCFIVFVRDDIYQILCERSPDFGKDLKAGLDWADPDLLRELLRKRIVLNGLEKDARFEDVWPMLIVSHINGQESSQYLIDRSLMRPRYLLKLLFHCKGAAINFNHERIDLTDVQKGLQNYSVDLIVDADQELADVIPAAEGFVYHLEREGRDFTKERLKEIMSDGGVPTDEMDRVLHFLLYYGILGIKIGDNDPEFIYNFAYNMKRLDVAAKKAGDIILYSINAALWNICDKPVQL